MPNIQEAKAFLAHSLEFYAAFERTSEYWLVGDQIRSAHTPAIVCLAFAAELGLKSLHLIERGKYPRGPGAHGLVLLYEQLSEETRHLIAADGVPRYPQYVPPKTFLDYLTDHDQVFLKWRYACEPGGNLVASEFFLKNLVLKIHSLAQHAIENAAEEDIGAAVSGRSRLLIK